MSSAGAFIKKHIWKIISGILLLILTIVTCGLIKAKRR